jgi:hypothetical protein
MGRMTGKRIISISVKATAEDAALFKRAAAALWPNAPITRSSYVLTLARMGAEHALRGKKPT